MFFGIHRARMGRAARNETLKNRPATKSVCDDVLIAIRRIIQSVDLHSKQLVKQFGLTGPQLIVLQEVSQSEEVLASELARAVSLSQPTVTGILDRLEKRGLIVRRRSNRDRRRVPAMITAAGKALLARTPPLMQESFIKQFLGLQSWEQHMILGSLQRLVTMMDARQISAAPILTTGPIGTGTDSAKTPPTGNDSA
jgi:DNA-binding MarR family transcriptional regulator